MRTLGEVLMTAAVVVVLLALWQAAAGAQNMTPASLGGGQASVLMVSDNGGGGTGPSATDRDKSTTRDDLARGWHEHNPFAPGGVLGERPRDQHHRDVNRGWGLLGLLILL
jgi:hypothetical protein